MSIAHHISRLTWGLLLVVLGFGIASGDIIMTLAFALILIGVVMAVRHSWSIMLQSMDSHDRKSS